MLMAGIRELVDIIIKSKRFTMIKKILPILILFLFSVNTSICQSFQRMAIAKGTYKLSARGSSKVTAYCLDFTRNAPTGGMNYGNILSGGSQAVVEVASVSGNVTRMSLDDAINKGYVGIEGANVFEGRGKEMLTEMASEARLRGESSRELDLMLWQWDDMTNLEKAEVENQMALALGLSGEGNHTALRFVNKTSNEIEIKLENNLQLGSNSERTALKGIDNLGLSSDAARQDAIQREIVWATRESQNLETLKKLGFYEGQTNVTKYDFEDVKMIYKDIQNKNDLRSSGEYYGVFDESMENWAKQQQRKLESELEEIGFVGDFDSAIKSYQKFKGARQTGNFSKSLKQSLKADIQKGIYVSKRGDVYNTKTLKTPNGKEKVFIIKPNLYIKFTNKNSIDLIQTKLNSRKYLQEEVEVISLVRDDATNGVLKQNFPNNHLAFEVPSMRGLIQKLKANKKKSVVVVGHIEGKEFVTPLANGKEFRVSLEDLKRLGDELDVNIFPMGCNSGFQGTGLANKFNSVDALNRLKPAVENNKTVMGMLEDLTGNDLKVIIDDIPFKDRGYLQAKIQREITEAGVAVIIGAGAAGLIIYSSLGDDEEDND
jgi:hypothetical protein